LRCGGCAHGDLRSIAGCSHGLEFGSRSRPWAPRSSTGRGPGTRPVCARTRTVKVARESPSMTNGLMPLALLRPSVRDARLWPVSGSGPHAHAVKMGGGFGGTRAALRLARPPIDATLVDRRNVLLFPSLAYREALGPPGRQPAPTRKPGHQARVSHGRERRSESGIFMLRPGWSRADRTPADRMASMWPGRRRARTSSLPPCVDRQPRPLSRRTGDGRGA